MEYDDLMSKLRAGLQPPPGLGEALRVLVEEAASTAEERFEATNVDRVARGLKPLVNDPVETLAFWPPQPCDAEDEGGRTGRQVFLGPQGREVLTLNPFGVPVSYRDTWAQWSYMERAIALLMKGYGCSREIAFRRLSFHGFHFTFGVVVAATDGERLPVGIRFGNVNHSGRLSLPGGLVEPGQSLHRAAVSELIEEVPGRDWGDSTQLADRIASNAVSITYGPHDKAPSATFVVTHQVPRWSGETVLANHEWACEMLVLTPLAMVRAALDGELGPITEHFALQGLAVTAGFAPDVAGPLGEHPLIVQAR